MTELALLKACETKKFNFIEKRPAKSAKNIQISYQHNINYRDTTKIFSGTFFIPISLICSSQPNCAQINKASTTLPEKNHNWSNKNVYIENRNFSKEQKKSSRMTINEETEETKYSKKPTNIVVVDAALCRCDCCHP